MAFCTYCGQQFQRNEHLERHLTTHTNVKRFKCHVCHMSFSRADVLQKHVAIHGDDRTVTTAKGLDQVTVRFRRRTQAACQNCARMKSRCDSNSPCNRCLARKITCDRRPKASRATAYPAAIPETDAGECHSPAATEMDVDGIDGIPVGSSLGEEGDAESQPANDGAQSPTTKLQQRHAVQDNENMTTTHAEVNSFTDSVGGRSLKDAETGPVPIEASLEGRNERSSVGQAHINDFNGNDVTFSENFTGCNFGIASPSIGQLQQGAIPCAPPQEPQEKHDDYQWNHSSPLSASAPEHQSIIDAQEFWSSFRCNGRNDIARCPRTAGVLLESLAQMPEIDRLWGWLDFDFESPSSSSELLSLPLPESIRDKLSAISQSFFRKALQVHKLDPVATTSPSNVSHEYPPWFLMLPPTATLEHFLREYVRIFEPYYSLVPGSVLDPSMLMNNTDNNAAILLLLLMIAQGAMSDPTGEARRLSGGLTEICRISLFSMIEKNVSLCHHHLLVHSALLFIIQGAWSGDKWLMDIGLGQRAIYISIVRNGGLFDNQHNHTMLLQPENNWDSNRASWLEQERLIRLTYAWVVLDLELSLFQDVNPLISVAELNAPMPSSDEIWLAGDTSSWQQLLSYQKGPPVAPCSLRTFFQWFLNDDLGIHKRSFITPCSLRLLLHPIHSLVHNFRQLLDCFDGDQGPRSFSPFTRKSANVRMEEVQSLLHRWLGLYKACRAEALATTSIDKSEHLLMAASLITYHVIGLNTVTGFAEVERLARRGLSDTQLRSLLPHAATQCIQSLDEALIHAGQVLYLLRNLDKKARPPWWPAALYRATMVLWVASVHYGQIWKSSPPSTYYLIDAEQPDEAGTLLYHPVPVASSHGGPFIQGWDGDILSRSPALTAGKTGSHDPITLEDPIVTLEVCLLAFRDGVATRLSEGIHRKLRRFLDSRLKLRDE